MTEHVQRTCPLCNQSQAKPYLKKQELILVRCSHCGMIYSNPVPAEMASGAFYDKDAAAYYLSPPKLESDYSPVRFERELKFFRQFCQRGRVLDVGCSTGAFLYQLNQRFPGDYETYGTDISGAPLDYAEQKGITIRRGNFLDEEFGGGKFDAVTFWAVMEHLPNPKQFLAKAASLLKAGGYCFILVPNVESLAVRILGSKYRYILPQHVNYFSRETLVKFSSSEFEISRLTSTHFNPLVILKDFRGARVVSDAERGALLQKTTAYKQNPFLKPAKVLYQLTESLLAPLFLNDNLLMVLRKK